MIRYSSYCRIGSKYLPSFMIYQIYLAEDLPRIAQMMKDNLSLDPELQCVGHARDGQELIEQLSQSPNLPHLILMDIKMPRLNGIQATAHLKALHPQLKILMTTVFDDEQHIFEAILAGADGYLLKDAPPGELHRSIREVMEGGAPMSPAIASKALAMLRRKPESTPAKAADHDLSEREIEILGQLSKGLRYRQVAENLYISEGTVRKHIENIYRKLQVHNKLSAVDKAKDLGVI